MNRNLSKQIGRAGLAGAGTLTLAFAAATLAAFRPTKEEQATPLPGDALIPDPMFSTTHAVTIHAPPSEIWPWLAQMGAGRAGWYSYDHIDNGGRPSARIIRDDLQHIAKGDLVPALPGAQDGFFVLAVTPAEDLVLGGPEHGDDRGPRATWEFYLQPVNDEQTRLLVRGRVAKHWLAPAAPRPEEKPKVLIEYVYALMAHLPKPALKGFAGFGHRVMQNAQLRGIKYRAEPRPVR